MKFSVVIPAHNEVECIGQTLVGIVAELEAERFDYEIVVVDDGSTDGTGAAVRGLFKENPRIVCSFSPYDGGFGHAVRAGLEIFSGDAVAIMMADGSDSPKDLVKYFRLIEEGYDCVFGSRFIAGAQVDNYPSLKKVVNRIVNSLINVVFRLKYNDTTNAFKAYRREVIESVHPILSKHFNLTVELPLKAVIRGSNFAVIPISWTNRVVGESKLSLREMGSRYLFIVLYALLERHLSRGDYLRPIGQAQTDKSKELVSEP